MGDAALSKLSTELENAGLLGGAAASMLGFIAYGEDSPGYLIATPTGAVWSKSISNASKHTADLGVAKLTLEGGSLSTTAAFAFDDEGLSDFNLLIEFEGANAATLLTLELDTAYAYRAPAKKQGSTIVGYTDPAQPDPVKLSLPIAAALEISIRRTSEGALSALTLHGTPAGASAIAQGIFRFDLGDDVLVLPKFGHVGLSLQDLFIDLSASAATPVSGLFPEAYAPSWTGVGAKSIGIHYPISKIDDEWVNATLDGFLLGFDGKVSAKGKVVYSTGETDKLVRAVTGEIDIRNDEVVRGALELDLDLEKATDSVGKAAGATTGQGLSSAQQSLLTTARNDTGTATSNAAFSFGGDLKCRAQIIRIPLNADDNIIGFDISVEAIETPGNPAGLILQGTAARAVLWLGLGGGAAGLLISGIDEDDGLMVAGGLGLTFLLICDVGDFIVGNTPKLLPTLKRLEFRKLGYRYVDFPAEGVNPEKNLHQITLDVVVTTVFDGTLAGLINAVGGRGIDTAQSFGKLFAKTASEIEIKGPLELEISNFDIVFEVTDAGSELVSSVDERVRRVAGHKDLQFKPRKFPAISLKEGAGGSGTSKIPKPIMRTNFVTKEKTGETQYGVSLQIRGLENPDFKLESPFVLGIVVYFSPEFGLEFEASLIVEPHFRFAIPYWVLADGAFELDKPIPGFDGVQNRISVDVGLINNKVARGQSIGKDNLRLLNDISNYDYRFGGEVAWGEAFRNDPVKQLEFLFVEAHYEGASPFITIGPVGIYGLAGLFGKNIAPGLPGDARDASAIASWIEGDGQSFDNVLDWPAAPTEATWHPAKNFEDDETLIVAGLKVRAGPVGSRTVDVEGLLMLGFNEFWLAAAGRVKIKVIDFEATAIVVYDDPSESFAIRIRFEFEVETSGGEEILAISGPIEISSGNHGFRVVIGHFRPERGGPIVARLFKDIFRAQLYAIYESEGQPAFGFALPGMDERPDLGKKAYSHGLLFQYGPKKIGPDAIHIRLHAVAGYNFGLADDPFMIVGEVFLSGGLHVKVLFVKVGFTLTAFLAGRLTDERFDFRGRIVIEIGMPWPIPDIEIPVPLGFTLGSGPGIPLPPLLSSAFALSHAEPKAEEFPAAGIPIMPIDAVIGLRFNKPIVSIFEGNGTATSLPDIDPIDRIDPAQPQNRPFVDIVKTTFDGEEYRIEYEHYLSDVRISHRPVGGGPEVAVPSMFASWEVPAAFSETDGAPDPSEKAHRAIYLNSLLQPGLDFLPEKLGKFISGQIVEGVLPPCQKPKRACMMVDGAPDIAENSKTGLRTAWRVTPYGAIRVRETLLPPAPSPILEQNTARLGWSGSALRLPREVRIDVPPASRVTGEIELHTVASRLVGAVLVTLDVFLADQDAPVRLLMSIEHAPGTPCVLDLKTEVLPPNATQISVDAQVMICTQRGVMVIKVEVAALKPNVHLRRMMLRGPQMIPAGTGRDPGNNVPDLDRWLKLAREFHDRQKLFLNELCFETVEATHDAWETVTQTFGNGPATDATIDQFIDSLLLEPNREYTVSYHVQSFGRSATDAESSDTIDDERSFNESSGLNKELRTVRFRTEAEPSQTIGRYVGFVYPASEMTPVYASHTVPVVSFRNKGLIKRIYSAHKGADVLMSRIRDLDGAELATAATGTLSISSGAAGEVMEGLVEECLDAAQGFTRIEVDIFERVLKPDTRYGLSVEDTSVTPGPDDLPPFRTAFRTSRHESFADHVAAANALLADPVQIPFIGPDPSQLLAPVFADVVTGTLAGHDALIEALYRRALAHETGRLAEEFGAAGDVAAQMVGQLADGTLAAFGIALELEEPLLGKDGVDLGGAILPLPSALQGKGITLHQTGAARLLSIRDRSGSRLVVFRSSDAAAFSAILAPMQLPVVFDGTDAIRAAVTDYVEKNFAALRDAQRNTHIHTVMTDLADLPEMVGGLTQKTGALHLNPVGGP